MKIEARNVDGSRVYYKTEGKPLRLGHKVLLDEGLVEITNGPKDENYKCRLIRVWVAQVGIGRFVPIVEIFENRG